MEGIDWDREELLSRVQDLEDQVTQLTEVVTKVRKLLAEIEQSVYKTPVPRGYK
jgi:phage shock protein A